MTAALEKELVRLTERHAAAPEGRAFAPLADCYRKLGRLDEAVELCAQGLERHPGYSTAVVILGKIHRDRNEPAAAREAFDRVLELDPMNLLARAELARLFERQDLRYEALEQWRQLFQHDPSSQEAEDAIERLEIIEREESPAPEPEDENAGVEGTAAAAEPERVEATPPPADEEPPAVLQAQLEEPEEPPRGPATLSGPATPTLARIYYEQGFKAKALEVYERVLEQRGAGDVALRERIDRIRDELQHVERRRAESPADADELLEAAQSQPEQRAGEAAAEARGSSERASEVEILAASIEASDPEREDYGHFRSWLNQIRER